MKDPIFSLLYKNALLSLALGFPLMIITAIFALITHNLTYKNLLMVILLISLVFILVTIISIKIKFIDYQGVFANGTKNKAYTILVIDIALAVNLILFRNIIMALVILGLWFIGAYFIAVRNMKIGNNNIFSKNKREDTRKKNNDDVIDIDEHGNYKR
jgi:hypothetical protein